ncbi:MAG: hypothetical protein HOM01_14180, partial [Kordiimonadaceae bacterium]|nr:hypothetical protein [Kordiimonadaceae bacterium]
DDFGGHAKRNEFKHGNDTRIGYGGTESLDTPSAYSDVAANFLKELGIFTERFYDHFDQNLYKNMGLQKGVLFDKNHFAQEKLVIGYGKKPWEEFVAETPLSPQAKKDLLRLQLEEIDYMPGKTFDEKFEILRKTSYETFLRDYAKVDEEIISLYQRWGISFWAVGINAIPASSVQGYGGMPGVNHTLVRTGHRGNEPYIFHFPDGNASVARLIVRALLPDAVPGSTMEDVVTAKVNYAEIDKKDNNVKIRLNSTVVHSVNTADSKAVDVTYIHKGNTHKVQAKKCIMACYNAVIPYICPEFPSAQKANLATNIKAPITYTKVLVSNWRAFAEQNMDFVYYTNDFYKQVELDYPVSMGDYKFGSTPDDPMVLHMCYVPWVPDTEGPDQWRVGRMEMLGLPFETYEDHVNNQLDQALGHAGFDVERDIEAITVNRWPHGYAYNPSLIWEPDYASEADKPWVKGRQTYGNIAIGNCDANAGSNTKSAIDMAYRAVTEVL